MPGIFGDDTGIDLVIFVCAADQILYEKLLALRMFDKIGMEKRESFRRHRLVIVPPDMIFGAGVAHNEFVFRRTARVLAGTCNNRALSGQFGFSPADGFLIEPRGPKVIKDCGEFLQS